MWRVADRTYTSVLFFPSSVLRVLRSSPARLAESYSVPLALGGRSAIASLKRVCKHSIGQGFLLNHSSGFESSMQQSVRFGLTSVSAKSAPRAPE